MLKTLPATYIEINMPGVFFVLKKHFIELAMAVLMLVCFYILSWEAAETAGRLIDVSGNIKADQVILVDAGHGGVDSGMVGIGGLKEKGINLDIAMKLKNDPGKKRPCRK